MLVISYRIGQSTVLVFKMNDSCITTQHISNNSSFRLKQPGVPDGFHGNDETLDPLPENYTCLVAQATGRISYLPP